MGEGYPGSFFDVFNDPLSSGWRRKRGQVTVRWASSCVYILRTGAERCVERVGVDGRSGTVAMGRRALDVG